MLINILKGCGITLGAMIGLLLLYVLFLGFCVLFIDKKKEYCQQSHFYRALADSLDALILFFCHIRIHVEGEERLPKDTLYLLVGNHLSGFDPLITMRAFRKEKLIFVSKPENWNIPVAGRLAARCCFRAIDRENPRNALRTIQDCARLIDKKAGPVVIYPEGTRSKTGELLPFHNGVFKIAQEAKVPIVVMSVSGSPDIKKNAPWRRTDVMLRILSVLPAEKICAMRTAAIGNEVRSILLGEEEADHGN